MSGKSGSVTYNENKAIDLGFDWVTFPELDKTT